MDYESENLNGYHVEDESMSEQHDQGEEEEEEATQLETQPATQSSNGFSPSQTTASKLWGYLLPYRTQLKRIDFRKEERSIRVGRNPTQGRNHVVLPGNKISNDHCEIIWDGVEGDRAAVKVVDKSSNGTYISKVKVGKGMSKVLRHGDEISFGPQSEMDTPLEDYRFTFFLTSAPPAEGVYAKYDIAHELGSGTFATVKKGMEKATGNWFAIKFINSKALRGQHGSRTSISAAVQPKDDPVEREIKVLGSMSHANICGLKEVFLDREKTWCLVLEFIAGGDLLEYIMTNEGVSEPMAQHFTYQMADALAYCHKLKITHRDLKPENILLTADNPPNIKIADFGLAKMVNSLTMLKTMCGTPSYLAPEVVTQTHKVGYNETVDCWSIGVIEYSMLTNQTPFIEDDNITDIRIRIAQRTVDWTALAESGVPTVVQQFIGGLLQYEPENRMTMAEALQHPWLQEYLKRDTAVSVSSGRGVKRDHTMESVNGAAPSIADMSMVDATAAVTPPTSDSAQRPPAAPSNLPHDMSRHLQRRKDVVKKGLNVDIPQAMLDYAQRHHPAADAVGATGSSFSSPEDTSNVPTPTQTAGPSASQTAKKRPREELTPLSELEENDGDVSMDVLSPRKKGRKSDEMEPKGKSAPAKPKSRAGKVKPASTDDGLRRSSRKTAKR